MARVEGKVGLARVGVEAQGMGGRVEVVREVKGVEG
jgi:hypothetical protein